MLSVVIIAKNEGFNIRRCLESVTWADEIIVLDSGSTDNTIAIATEFTPYVYATATEAWQGYGIQKQRALAYATHEWVLNLDADEVVDAALKAALIRAMTLQTNDAYRIPIQMWFYGKQLRYSASPSRHIRLFQRAGAAYSEDLVHEKITLPSGARVGQLQVPIQHHSFQDLSHALYKMNRYSSYSARIRIQEGRSFGFIKTLLSACWMFCRCYVLQRGFLDGKAGLLLAVLQAEGSFYRGMKQGYGDCMHTRDEE